MQLLRHALNESNDDATSSSGELPLGNEHDIVLGRQAVRRMTQQLGFSLVDQTKMVTAASELARNALIYGGGGILNGHC